MPFLPWLQLDVLVRDEFPNVSERASVQKAREKLHAWQHDENHHRPCGSLDKDGQWLTMSVAAAKLGVNNHRIRRLIKEGLLPAQQVVPRVPFQIRARDLLDQQVIDPIAQTRSPRRPVGEKQIPMLSST